MSGKRSKSPNKVMVKSRIRSTRTVTEPVYTTQYETPIETCQSGDKYSHDPDDHTIVDLYEDEDDNEFAPWLDANLMKLFPGLDQTQYQDTDEFLNYIGPYQYEIMRFAFRSASRLTEFRLLPAEIMWSSIHYVFSHWKRFPELDQYTDLPVAFLFFLSRKTVIIVLNGMGFSKLNNQYQKWFDHF